MPPGCTRAAISVTSEGSRYVFRDLFIDVKVPMDGRHYRMLDLDEFADAIAQGTLSLQQAADGLQRWQRFRARYPRFGGRAFRASPP